MAKRPRSKKKRGKFGEAVKALQSAKVPHQEFGGLRPDGSHTLDPTQVEKLKKKVGKAAWKNVRFVALNAPFKRRSSVPAA